MIPFIDIKRILWYTYSNKKLEVFPVERLTRKIDTFLVDWKKNNERFPLIVKGARQIGKTEAIKFFAESHYQSVVEINFVLQKQYKSIFDDGFEVDTILKNISLINPDFEFPVGETLIFLMRSRTASTVLPV